MSTADKAAIALAVIAALGLLLTVWQLLQSAATERRRTQPIVVAHERRARHFNADDRYWQSDVEVTNEGLGPAFNVRFGVSYFGARFAFRLHEDDPPQGNRQRVVHPREPLAAAISISSLDLWGGALNSKVDDERAFYWARFESARGQTWEARNPPDRSADLDIRRVRLPKLRERLEVRRRRQLTKVGADVERKMLGELQAARESDAAQPFTPSGGKQAGAE